MGVLDVRVEEVEEGTFASLVQAAESFPWSAWPEHKYKVKNHW